MSEPSIPPAEQPRIMRPVDGIAASVGRIGTNAADIHALNERFEHGTPIEDTAAAASEAAAVRASMRWLHRNPVPAVIRPRH